MVNVKKRRDIAQQNDSRRSEYGECEADDDQAELIGTGEICFADEEGRREVCDREVEQGEELQMVAQRVGVRLGQGVHEEGDQRTQRRKPDLSQGE